MKRRQFLKATAAGTLGVTFIQVAADKFVSPLFGATGPDAVWVEGGEPEALLESAMNSLGGMQKFISSGDVVVIKPNMAWDRAPEYAATTNPDLIAAITKQCKAAGAKSVKVFDRTCNNPLRCYRSTKIQKTAEDAGADVGHVRDHRFTNLTLDNGQLVKEWPIYDEYLEADKVINVPIAKHHSMSRVTLGLKNLMGVMGGERGDLHNHFPQKLADINAQILPTLTIIDAYRMLMHNGPVGGNLSDVKMAKTLIASSCTVTADAMALELFDLDVDSVPYIREAFNRGLNKFAQGSATIQRINLG
ncbi:MAG: DUF362 domain-containing protein [Candidatus Marinimicrobia bacterium]|nr:DUF362 domain-containing protein [Candidatus Neomarinimicrobiota bacterium]